MMTLLRCRAAIGLVVLVSTVGIAAAQTPEVSSSSATVRIVRKPVDLTLIAIENRHSSPLVEWAVTIYSDASRKMPQSSVHDYRHQGPFQSGDGPLQPGEVRRMRAARTGVLPTAVGDVTLAVFADGTYDGTPEMVKGFLAERAAMADDLAYWLTALEQAPAGSDDQLATYLREKAAEREKQQARGISGVRASVLNWFGPTPPKDGLRAGVTAAVADIRGRLESARRFAKTPRATSGLRERLSVRTEKSTGTDIIVLLENKRAVPLEAWQIDIYSSVDPNLRRSARRSDYAILLADTPGVGRIAPGETREIVLGAAEDRPELALPPVKLGVAIWQDLHVEGDPSVRDEFFKQRDADAARYAFWIAAINEAATRPAGDAIAYLMTKRRERRKAAPDEGDLVQDHLVVWSSRAAADPMAPATWLRSTATRFEKQRQLLLRHRRK